MKRCTAATSIALGVVVELEAVSEVALHADSVRSRKPPCSSYDEVTTASASRRATLAQAGLGGVRERRRQQPLDPREALGGKPERTARMQPADGAACPRREADQIRRDAAFDAGPHVRQVTRQPEELELERERERFERRAAVVRDARLVEQVEEARERDERALVRLRLREQAQHRLDADQTGAQAIRLLPRRTVRAHEVDARDRVQLAGALVQEKRDVRQRLEARAEARLRLPDALRDRTDAAALARVEVEDAVGFGEAHRTKDDRLRLVCPPGHVRPSLERPSGSTTRARAGRRGSTRCLFRPR